MTVADPKDYDRITVRVNNLTAAPAGYITETSSSKVLGPTVIIPRELTTGPATLVVITDHGTSATFPIQLASYSPAFYIPSSNCSRTEQRISLNAVGLGQSVPAASTNQPWVNGFQWGIAAALKVTIGGVQSEIRGSQAWPWLGGYGIEAVVPAEVPDGIQKVVLEVGGVKSSEVDVVVGSPQSLAYEWARDYPDSLLSAPDALMTSRACRRPLAETVVVKDAEGVERPARVVSAIPDLVRYVVPGETALGRATVISGENRSPLDVRAVAPALFTTLGSSWRAAPVGYLLRTRDGVSSIESFPGISSQGSWVPIEVHPDTDDVVVVLYGSGFRNRRSLDALKVFVGDWAEVLYAGASPEFPGVDQINFRLPKNVKWKFDEFDEPSDQPYPIRITVDGITAPPVYLAFK